MNPTSRRLRLFHGLTLHVLEYNAASPSDHTLVLLHGYLDLARAWHAVVQEGLGDAHIIAPDLRGHGDSDRVGAGGYYHFIDYVADVDDLVQKLGRARVSVVGHSMGGLVASYYAGVRPERVHRLALLEGLGPPEAEPTGPSRTARWLSSWRQSLGRAPRPNAPRPNAPRPNAPRTYATLDEAAARLSAADPKLSAAMARDLAFYGTRATADGRLVFKHDPAHLSATPYGFSVEAGERFWRAIACPVLLVDGAESDFKLAAEDRARRERAIGDVRRVVIAGAGHMMLRHRPGAVAEVLRGFLL